MVIIINYIIIISNILNYIIIISNIDGGNSKEGEGSIVKEDSEGEEGGDSSAEESEEEGAGGSEDTEKDRARFMQKRRL